MEQNDGYFCVLEYTNLQKLAGCDMKIFIASIFNVIQFCQLESLLKLEVNLLTEVVLDWINWYIFVLPGSPSYKKQGNHRKSYIVNYENITVIENTIEVYGNMQVIKRPYNSMIPCNSYTVPMEDITLKCEIQNFW